MEPFAPEDEIKTFIEYGFARTKSEKPVIDEPLVIMAAWNWLDTQGRFSLLDCLRREVGEHAPRKNGFEAYLAFYVRKAFEQTPKLNEIFTFRGDFSCRSKSDLFWQGEEFELVTVSTPTGTDEQKISVITPSCGPSSNVTFLAKTDDDVLKWISENKDSYAFCFPTEAAGPDFYFYLRHKATEKLLLVALQAKHYDDVDKATLIQGVRTVTPSLFGKSKGEKGPLSVVASRFLDALMNFERRTTIVHAAYPIFRVFASWPGDPKLERTQGLEELKGGNATKSRAEVDEDSVDVIDPDMHPLATLHLATLNAFSSKHVKSWYLTDTEQTAVVHAKDQYNNEEQV